jgi:hypothetical protein
MRLAAALGFAAASVRIGVVLAPNRIRGGCGPRRETYREPKLIAKAQAASRHSLTGILRSVAFSTSNCNNSGRKDRRMNECLRIAKPQAAEVVFSSEAFLYDDND